MREIKFRVYYDGDGKKGYVTDTAFTLEELAKELHGGHIEAFGGSVTHIFEQYTGLKDKNGKDIYDGDIVKWFNATYAVKWDKDYACYLPFAPNDGDGEPWPVEQARETEVIGNIHENPEILEEK